MPNAEQKSDYLEVGGGIAIETINGVPSYRHADLLGSPRLATDSTGQIYWREHYDPYGFKLNGVADKVGYTGHVYDAESGLTYAQARFYDAQVGRFLSGDPEPFKDTDPFTFNRYAYGNNSPYNNTDPTGATNASLTCDKTSCTAKITVTGSRLPQPVSVPRSAVTPAGGATGSSNGSGGSGSGGTSSEGGNSNSSGSGPFSGFASGPSDKPLEGFYPELYLIEAGLAGKLVTEALTATDALGLGANPFANKSAEEVGEMFAQKGYFSKGPDPVAGRGTYINPKTGRGYHIDANHPAPKGPHVGVHRPREFRDTMAPRDYPMGEP